MKSGELNSYGVQEITELISKNIDAVLLVDEPENKYRTIIKKGFFQKFLKEEGEYKELIEELWFHLNESQKKITEDYHVFIPTFGKFEGKYSKKLKLSFDGNSKVHVIQMTVYPLGDERYMFLMDDLDNSEYIQEYLTTDKVSTIQNTYLFSMYIDLVQNTTSSISITEISDDTVHSSISYTEWRMMIVNMIGEDDQSLFLERTDPEYLKKNFAPGRTSSFDCLMQNLEGKYIWVKLIFSRAKTTNEDDYRFVFMVQNIHENSVELFNELTKYEELALMDSLTEVYNHGRMETEIINALYSKKKFGTSIFLMMLDIDYFKHVNDTYGHSVGDDTLRVFVDIICDCIDEKDTTVGRWGGEEFVIVVYETNREKVLEIAERIRKNVEETIFPVVGQVTCSIGVTEMKADDTSEKAFCRMDKAMYKAKNEGRNCIRELYTCEESDD
ncbi:MAG: GGDEF domain-containing protein [Lachnospiraceae bacterium]|nr:GGDEF domain-containing protein [Lachnospiraceae bacterium]